MIKELDPSPAVLFPRDDDAYFSNYNQNDIHVAMIRDKVRTSTYASFILTNHILFHDAVVLDVGCGTGILSLFAAKSGAKHVYAVEASKVAEKAEQIVKANGLENVITVIRGKVEEISLPDDVEHVDIIISEWMGYALLYESMLDSVLRARDRFLKPEGGVMAPSQCRIMFGLCEGSEILEEYIDFWSDVYGVCCSISSCCIILKLLAGFDLSVMGKRVYKEAIIDVIEPGSMANEPYLLKDFHIRDVTASQLDFTSQFTLVSTTRKRTKIHAFVLYFDTFFTTTGEPVPPEVPVRMTKEGDVTLTGIWPSTGSRLKPKEDKKVTSFSTGPCSKKTHWKQTIFLLRDPIYVEEGTIVTGSLYYRKNATNYRDLDVEIHYFLRQNAETSAVGETVVEIYKML
ncbi:S-adenosyl-L-methionine-dependent methyltransferase [Suillus decipiens]|nr:S-adenosyl-L-methionine-dependent methyltransferase [Suillus decipiens]